MPKTKTIDRPEVDIDNLAMQVSLLMNLIDGWDIGELEALKRMKEQIISNISHNEAVMIIAMACGGREYDRGEDAAKVKELEGLIKLVEARMELRGVAHDKAERAAFDGNSLYR